MGNAALDVIAFTWPVADIAAQASLTNILPAVIPDSADITGFVMPTNGYIVGVSLNCPVVAATTIQCQASLGGVAQAVTAATITNPATAVANILPTQLQIPFAAGAVLGLSYLTTGAWTVKDFIGIVYVAVSVNYNMPVV